MNEEKLYDTIAAALSGVQYVEERTNSLCEEIRKVECEDAPINTDILREGLVAIADAIDEIETLLFNPTMIRKEEATIAARYRAIENSAQTLVYFKRPELIDKELSPEEAEFFHENYTYLIGK